jgi:hypothetical protein
MKKSSLAFLALAGVLVACAPATQRAYVAPSRESVIWTPEQREAKPPAVLIYIENHSTVPVIVFAMTLTSCENIKNQCGVRNTNLRVDAGGRTMAVRVEPQNDQRAWNYSFGFSWHADSSYGKAALNALAEGGDESARVRLAAIQHSDSLRKAETGPPANELSRTDFPALASRIASMRAYPDSLVIAPGERTSIERIRLLLLDSQGSILGQTRWVSWRIGSGAVEFVPPYEIVAKRPGRTVIHFALASEPQKMLASPVPEIDYPVIVAYPTEPHAPVFNGRAVDSDTKNPLACAHVALEDSAQNVVARSLTSQAGTFVLPSPRPGTYRVRVETPGWAPVYGPSELAKADEDKQHEYVVKFTDQMLMPRYMRNPEEIEHARPVSLRMEPTAPKRGAAAPVVNSVTLGGSEAMPILGIVGRAPAGTSWMQFVVDSTGQVDATSITLPLGADPRAITSVTTVLPHVHFAPARESGKAECELLRMQVNFSAR